MIGASKNKEDLNINYDEISRAEFTDTGALIKTADLFFLGGGKNVSSSRNNSAIFFEILSELDNELLMRTAKLTYGSVCRRPARLEQTAKTGRLHRCRDWCCLC